MDWWVEYLKERGKFHLVSYFVVSFLLNVVRLCFFSSSDGTGYDLVHADLIINYILNWGFIIIFSAVSLIAQPYLDLLLCFGQIYGPEIPFERPMSVGTDLSIAFIVACVFQVLVILWHAAHCVSYVADEL